jgi:hypothetical protein
MAAKSIALLFRQTASVHEKVLHLQTVDSHVSFKKWLDRFHRVATNYLGWCGEHWKKPMLQ